MLKVVYSDQDLIVIEKPSAIHSVEIPGKNNLSIVKQLKEITENDLPDCGLINRLDFETAGLLLAAKNQKTYDYLKTINKNFQIKKCYHAIIEGQLKADLFVDLPIGQSSRSSKTVRVFKVKPSAKYRAQLAQTRFLPISYSERLSATLVEAELSKGLRHQIRAHAASQSHSLVGDALYGAKSKLPDNIANEFTTFFLFASALSFKHPASGKLLDFNLPLPEVVCEIFKI